MSNEIKRYASEDCVDSKINSAFEKHNTFTIEYAEPIKISLADIPIFNKVISNGTATYGTVEIVDGQTFIYTPTTYLLGAETVVLTFDDNTTYDVYINPADNIYYDASFFNIADATGWLYVEDETGSYAVATVDTGTNQLVPHFVGTGFALYGKYSLDNGALCSLLVERANSGSTLARSATNSFNGYNVPVYEKVISEHDTWDVRIVRNKTNTEGAKLELSGIRIYNTIYDESSPSFTSVAEKVKKSNSDTNGTATSVIYLAYNTETKAFDRTLFDSAISNSQVYHAFEINKTGDSPKIWVSANAQPNKSTLSSVDSYNDNIAVSHSKSIHLDDGVMKFVPLETVNYNGKNYVLISSPTGITALGAIKCVDCEIVTQADQAAVNAFVEDVIRIANGTLIATLETTKQLEEAIAGQQTEIDGKQPKGNYALSSELAAETTAREQAVADLNARLGQQNLLIAEGETMEDALAWLETNGDKTKAYLMPDDFFYMWRDTTEVGGVAYTNLLPLSTDTDRSTIYNGKGYKENTRLSGSGGGTSTSGTGKEAMCTSGFMFPVNAGDILRIKGAFPITSSSHYVVGYDSANARTGNDAIVYNNHSDGSLYWTTDASSNKYVLENADEYNPQNTTIVYTINTAKLGENVNTIRICMGMDENTIVTLNEEIKAGGGTVIVEKWASTGHTLTSSDFSDAIARLIAITDAHTAEINKLKEDVEGRSPLTDAEKLEAIKTWDAPIYDANIPIFELSAEKAAITEAEKTVDAVYAKYDALMTKHPNYITKTNLGMCSDGVTPVYRYDFREPEPHRGVTGAKEWSETKAKAIIVSGIHWEWGGIFALYNAIEEIAENPNLYNLRRNTHLIVLPVCNPYAVANMSVRNANLVEIHRNFEVDFIYPGEPGYIELGERSHGGTEPLSEVETQYIDNILRDNTDAALFLTCHSNQSDSVYGTGFTWASPATYYMCNMHYRLVDKLSAVWMEKYGDELAAGIADYRTENTPEWDNRLGSAYLSTTNGTETKQATKYGIQATNIEITDAFLVHGTKANPEPALSSFTMSRGAEVYVNFLLTAFGVYRYTDKEAYYK